MPKINQSINPGLSSDLGITILRSILIVVHADKMSPGGQLKT